MSLVPSLRQATTPTSSSFRQLLPTRRIPITQSTLTLLTATTQRRQASSVAQATTAARSVQDVERELAEQRKMMDRAAKLNPGMDISSQVMPVFEPIIDPPKPLSYFLQRNADRAYKAERKGRAALTRQAIAELTGRGGIDEYRNSGWRWTVPDQVRNLWVMFRREKFIKKTMRSLADRYNEYQAIQASGTVGQANAIAKEHAFAAAQNVIRKRKDKMTWELIKENHPPYLVSARISIVDPRSMAMAGQMVVRFDTEQALTTHKPNGSAVTKQQRVVENIIFERFVPPKDTSGWKIKGKLVEAKGTPTAALEGKKA